MLKLIAPLALAATLVVLDAPAHALDKCKDVDVTVINSHPSNNAVKVLYVKYQVNGAGTWYKEDVSDKVPTTGNRSEWSNQTFGSLPDGSGAKFRVYFKEQLSGGLVPKYGDTRYIEYDRLGSTCTDGRDYTFNVNATGTKGE